MSDLQKKTGRGQGGIPVPTRHGCPASLRHGRGRRGLGALEVVVVLALMFLFVLCAAMMLPRRREAVRLASCQRNLMQVGIALALYEQGRGSLPTVPAFVEGDDPAGRDVGPLMTLLGELGFADFTGLADRKTPTPKQAGPIQTERRVPGFTCPSDRHAISALFPAPVSYRACAGDSPRGENGAFAPGRTVSIAHVEATDGASYTAGFAERLVGDNRAGHPALANYALARRPLGDAGCPPAAVEDWRGDAGSSWVASDWRSTLYNHALRPDDAPSCIAADRRSSLMGASSGHEAGVNVLLLDGAVRTFTARVDAKIWRGWASVPEGPDPTAPRP
jgi:hypothetical protein